MSMTLDDLLNSLEKQASEQEESKDKKKNGVEKEDEDDAEDKEDSASWKLRSAEKDLEDAKKIEDRVKEAHLQGSALANEIMQKVASANQEKRAFVLGAGAGAVGAGEDHRWGGAGYGTLGGLAGSFAGAIPGGMLRSPGAALAGSFAGQTAAGYFAGKAYGNSARKKEEEKLKAQKETNMNKSAQFAGQALAQSLLMKLAGAGDFSTSNGIYEGAMPNKAQVDNAQMVAEHDMTIDPTPTKDEAGDGGGSVNQIFDAIIQKAMSQGAASVDQVHGTGISQYEGMIADRTAPGNAGASDGAEEEVEKVAAVNALMNTGFDIFSAVDMVKAAEQELLYEQDMQIKQAAMNELLNAGVDFELAAAMVKQAGVREMAATAGAAMSRAGAAAKGYATRGYDGAKGYATRGYDGAKGYATRGYDGAKGYATRGYDGAKGYADRGYEGAKGYGQRVVADARDLPTQAAMLATGNGATRGDAFRQIAGNRAAQLGAGVGAAGLAAGGYALAREKQAAMSGLIDAGVDFELAAALVAETSQELYGA